MAFADPLLDVMLQTLRNPNHLFHFAMRNSSADVVTAHISLFTECVEGSNELGVFSHGEFQRLNNPIVMTVARHNSKQISDLLLAALMRDEPAVLDPIGETHARLQSRTASFLWRPPTKSDSWRRASPETLADRTPSG